jgi:Uma2 family endonuclease
MAGNPGSVTADELLRMDGDGWRRELVEGRLRVMEPAGFEHGRVALRIGRLLDAHVEATGSGVSVGAETGFVLARDPDTVRAPDAAFVAKARANAVGTTARYWPGAPDLAVEVVSPDDSAREVKEKAQAWLAAGTVAVLVLDPAKQTATIYRSHTDARVQTGSDTLDLSDAVPDFKPALSRVFAGATP